MTDVWSKPRECELCGISGERLEAKALVEWLEALPGMTYAHVDRCDDRAACRARVEAAVKAWPVRERAA
jgi:hypothetical protein